MSESTDEPTPRPTDDEQKSDGTDGRGAEVGMTEGEGSTFEPEEDPEGHDD